MKHRNIVLPFIIILILSFVTISFSEEWACTSCGNISQGNYCSNCGTKHETWECPACGKETSGIICTECNTARSRIDDQCSLFSEAEKNELQQLISEIENNHHVFCLVVTSRDVPKDTANSLNESMKYADTYYEKYFAGQKDPSGLLYLIDMKNRISYISTAGSVITTINDKRLEILLSSADPSLAKGKYGKAAITLIEQFDYMLYKSQNN